MLYCRFSRTFCLHCVSCLHKSLKRFCMSCNTLLSSSSIHTLYIIDINHSCSVEEPSDKYYFPHFSNVFLPFFMMWFQTSCKSSHISEVCHRELMSWLKQKKKIYLQLRPVTYLNSSVNAVQHQHKGTLIYPIKQVFWLECVVLMSIKCRSDSNICVTASMCFITPSKGLSSVL